MQCGIGGCPLEKHWANVEKSGDKNFKPYGIAASLSSGETRKFPGRANVTDMLAADKWDIVTIQQASGRSAFYDTYQPYADNLIAKIRELAPQAEIVIHIGKLVQKGKGGFAAGEVAGDDNVTVHFQAPPIISSRLLMPYFWAADVRSLEQVFIVTQYNVG